MKWLNGNDSVVTRFVIIGSLTVIVGFTGAFVALSPAPEGKFSEQSQAVRDDIEAVGLHQDAVQLQRENLRDARKSNDKLGVISAKQELRKSKADLKRDKAYLKADKKALACLHKEDLKATSGNLKDDKCELRSSKKQLKADLRKGHTAYLVEDAQQVKQNQEAVNKSQATLNDKQQAYEGEMVTLDDDLDKVNGRGVYATNDSPREKARDFFGIGLVDDEPLALQ